MHKQKADKRRAKKRTAGSENEYREQVNKRTNDIKQAKSENVNKWSTYKQRKDNVQRTVNFGQVESEKANSKQANKRSSKQMISEETDSEQADSEQVDCGQVNREQAASRLPTVGCGQADSGQRTADSRLQTAGSEK